jgi:hypothetical protein
VSAPGFDTTIFGLARLASASERPMPHACARSRELPPRITEVDSRIAGQGACRYRPHAKSEQAFRLLLHASVVGGALPTRRSVSVDELSKHVEHAAVLLARGGGKSGLHDAFQRAGVVDQE